MLKNVKEQFYPNDANCSNNSNFYVEIIKLLFLCFYFCIIILATKDPS